MSQGDKWYDIRNMTGVELVSYVASIGEKVEAMTERSNCMPSLSLGPNALKRAVAAFDQSWTAIAANFSDAEAETARTQLATLILGLSADGSRDAEQEAAALEFVSREPRPSDLMH